MRPLDFLGRIKIKLGLVILLAVAAAFLVNEVGINAGIDRNVRVAVAAVLALLMVQLLARGMIRPLREMAAAAQTIAKGRYGQRVRATSRDEVGELARAFNAMATDLGEVDRQRRELVANVSHELRTPITALRAVLENLVDGVSTPDPQTLGTALAQTERLGRLVAQLLDLSRIDSGALLLEPESVSVEPLLGQAVREAGLARDDVTLRCEAPAALTVRADPALLARVLANLLDNAVRHSPPGGLIVVSAAEAGAGVRIEVGDQGPGIPAGDHARVFERFSRLDAARAADAGGAGLGLAIVKEIVELHGGSIRIAERAGCQMVVDLPGRIVMTTPTPAPQKEGPGEVHAEGMSDGVPESAAGSPGAQGVVLTGEPDALTSEGRDGKDEGTTGPQAGTPGTPVGVPSPGDSAGDAPEHASGGGHGSRPPGEAPGRPAPVPPYPPYPPATSYPRNWPAAFGMGLGGAFLGLIAGAVLVFTMASMGSGLLAAAGGLLSVAAGAFVGTVFGATRVAWLVPSPRPLVPSWPAPVRPASAEDAAFRARTAGPLAHSPALTPGSHPPASTTRASGVDVPVLGVSPSASAVGPRASGVSRATGAGQDGGAGPRGPGGAPRRPNGGYVPPSVLPRPEVPTAPWWVLPLAAVVGVVAAVAVPYGGFGVGVVIAVLAVGLAAVPAVWKRLTWWSAGLGLIGFGLVSIAMVLDGDWLVAPLMVAGFCVLALAISGAGQGFLGVLAGGLSVALALIPLPWFLAGPMKALTRRRPKRLAPIAAGLGLTLGLVVVFGALFASADAVFSGFVSDLLVVPDWLDSVPVRVFVFALFAVLVAAAVLAGLRPVNEPKAPKLGFQVNRTMWVLPLGALNLLFAAFVGVQVAVLFGGDQRVLTTAGLTYADYARQGFFQLVVVSVFVLAIVAVAAGVISLNGWDRWLMAVLLGVLCALTMVILVSALQRLSLYVEVYGFTRLRASVGATIMWLGAVFALVLVAGAVRLARRRGGGWLPRALVVVTALGLISFAVWNPDLRVAETQVAIRGDRLDSDYLGDLGAEAVSALDKLPEPERSCVLADVVAANGLAEPDPWNGWNLARERARDLLAVRPVIPSGVCPAAAIRFGEGG
ncbi:DUF4153 domain-containing protein [Streptosporangium soli]|nr:DUF4173 domain-containing protein [Streptosporangium sp. KLBMP 9127]